MERNWAGNEPRRLRVYQLALHAAGQVDGLCRRCRCDLALKDQVRRAADSVVLNIAEGSAHRSPAQKARHYQIAHASAAECIAGLDLLRNRDPRTYVLAARRNLQMTARMLHRLIDEWRARR